MLLKQCFLGFMGLCAGGVIAAGIFAFLAAIGIFPRLMGKTQTQKHIFLFETLMIIGGTIGCFLCFKPVPFLIKSRLFLAIAGGSVGIFTGCLVMSLSETLKAFPVFGRRIHLAVGIQYVIVAFAIGKLVSALIYFANGMFVELP